MNAPPESRFAETLPDDVVRRRIALPEAGIEIAVQDWGGDGPPALFHHANGFCAALWAPIIESIRDRYRVFAMDARGSGDSPAPPDALGEAAFAWNEMAKDVEAVAAALLEETGAERIELGVGHSFGGTLVMTAEAHRPGLFGRLIGVDPVTPPPPSAVMPDGAASRAPLLADMARRRRHVWPNREEAFAHFSSRPLFQAWTERALRLYVGEGLADREDGQVELKCSPESEARVFDGSGAFDVFQTLAGLAPPVLLLWAEHGNFPRHAYERLIGSMKSARILDVDAGHLIPMERPDLVLGALEDFVAR